MGVSPTNSQVFFNFSSLFAQGNNKNFASVQAAAANYANGAFQVRSASITVADVLDLSPEGLTASQQVDNTEQSTESMVNENNTVDTTLKASELSEAERVEIIRVNKNAVLSRVNELLAEKGVEVSADQTFELTTNLMDGSISVKGIEDTELLASFNEALQGDEQLVNLMRKTRNELGISEQENTVPRNFTIQYNSMQETPEGVEIDFNIDLFITQPQNLLEDGTNEGEDASDEQGTATYQMSITLSNRINIDASLLDQSGNSNVSSKKEKDNDEIDDEETEEAENINAIAVEADDVSEENSFEPLPVNELFSAFGSYFQATSSVNAGTNGLDLNWHLQFSNWNATQQSDDAASLQQLYQTMNIGGSMQFPFDETGELTTEQQAQSLQNLFAQGMNGLFSQGSTSPWTSNFLGTSGLSELGFFG